MGTPESNLKRRVIDMIRTEFPSVWCYKVSDRFTANIPDLIGVKDGSFFGIELKAPGKDARPGQFAIIHKIRKAGGYAVVARSVDEVREFLQEINK